MRHGRRWFCCCYFGMDSCFWGYFRSVFGFVLMKGKKKKRQSFGSCRWQWVLARGYSRPEGAWLDGQSCPTLCLEALFFSLCSFPKGSIGFPGFPGANGEKGTRVRVTLIWTLWAFFVPSPGAGCGGGWEATVGLVLWLPLHPKWCKNLELFWIESLWGLGEGSEVKRGG